MQLKVRTRFWNEYHWGDLKADPAALLARYFDAHLYVASWGSRRLLLRVPAESVDVRALKPCFKGPLATLTQAGSYVVLESAATSGTSSPAPLAPMRVIFQQQRKIRRVPCLGRRQRARPTRAGARPSPS